MIIFDYSLKTKANKIMSLIKKSNELDISSSIKMMIYGQPGMGKTTLALSCPKPLLLDFDNGVKRVNINHLENIDIVQVTCWNDVNDLMREDLRSYQTIVVDTIGKMLDCIIEFKCGKRIPKVQDWNGINYEFSNFINSISSLNKNVIFVAHRDTRKEGDDTVFIPALREKSYNSIVTELDLLGYMETKSENGRVIRTITFDPTNRNDGKNTCNLPSCLTIPNIINNSGKPTSPNNFISQNIIVPYKKMIELKKQLCSAYNTVVEEIKDEIELITDATSANDFVSRIEKFNHVGSSKEVARNLLQVKVKDLGLIFNKATKLYEDTKAA